LPPLRERKEDIPDLVDYFVKQISFSANKRVRNISSKFYQRLMHYDWPGNIRELRNAVYHGVTLMEGMSLDEHHLNSFFEQVEQTPDVLPKNSFNRTLSEIEREAIKGTLVYAQGNKRKAARILGIGRATLHRKLKAYDLQT
jgi:DNA-binding NtrC family response regulator